MDQRSQGSTSKTPPRPSYAAMLARGSPSPSSPPTTLARIIYDPVFVDQIDGHLAHLPIPPMGLRPEELVNPRAVAYKVPARYKVSVEAFADAAAKSLSRAINPTNGPPIAKPFLSAIRHPGAEFDRMEIVYHEDLDAFKVSTTPIVFKRTAYPPLTSTIDFTVTKITFSEYQFHTSADAGDNLCAWVRELLEIKKAMGKVILIEIPTRSSPDRFHLPNHQVFVYVKGDVTPEAAGLGRQHSLPYHQRNPVRVHWTAHGDPNFCNYCKSEGHVLGKCALRLSKICSKCKAAGHLQPKCDRFSGRDLKAAKAAVASSSSPLVTPSSAPAAFASLLEAAKAVPASPSPKGRRAVRPSTSGVAPPAPAETRSPSTSLSPSQKAVLSSIAPSSPSQSPSSSPQEFSPTVLSLVSSPRFIPGPFSVLNANTSPKIEYTRLGTGSFKTSILHSGHLGL
ncbi:hypothetical protein BGZ88_008194 [Linnemannia elongata]|nr:hypothetical protein BGZ88_008194 [Linnemannia elongata]